MRFIDFDSTARRTGKGQSKKIRFRVPHAVQTASAPTLSFGDGDTGLWEPSDDVLNIGTSGAAAITIAADKTVTLAGNLVVSGTQTTVDSTTLTVDDKNLELGSVDTPSDTTADGGGITLKGATDKTFNWVNSTDAWTSSEHINLASGKTFQLNGTAITSTAAELNILDGVTSSTAELNILDGVTSTATELNLLDGVTSTTAELNYTDGVTSAIQTQLDAKLPLAGGTMSGNIVMGDDTSIGIADDAERIEFDGAGDISVLGANFGIGTTSPGTAVMTGMAPILGMEGTQPGINLVETGANGGEADIALEGGILYISVTGSSAAATENQLRFRTTSTNSTHGSLTVPLTITSAGNVGLGTTAPATLLHLNGGNPQFRLEEDTDNDYIFIDMVQGGRARINTSDARSLCIQEDGGYVGIGTTGPDRLLTVARSGETPFKIRNTNTGAGQNLYLEMENDGGGDCYISVLQNASQGYIKYTDANEWYFQTAGMNNRAWIDNSGNFSSTGDITSSASDGRLKENKVPITSAIKKVTQLKGITYDWVDNINEVVGGEWNPDKKRAGLIAQDVQKVFPEVVSLAPFDRTPEGKSRSGKDYLTVDYASIVPLLVEAIKEQQVQIEELKKVDKQKKKK